MILKYSWPDVIEPRLDNLQDVIGGYSPAKRGVITLADGTKVFVKIGVDPNTKKWLQKEIIVYERLNNAGYKYIPKILSKNDDQTAMAIEYLDGYSFEKTWDFAKQSAVVAAQESLKNYKDLFIGNDEMFDQNSVVETGDKWQKIILPQNVEGLNKKLAYLGVDIAFTVDELIQFQKIYGGWPLKSDTLIHEDIRADNFGYDPVTKTGKLIDWNWLSIGDSGLDTASLFVDIYQSGFDPYKNFPEKYDPKMLVYLIGFWLSWISEADEKSENLKAILQSQARSVKACMEMLER